MYNHLQRLLNRKDGINDRLNYLSKDTFDGVKYCYNKSLCVHLLQILIFLPLKILPIPFNPGLYMLKSGVVVKWPEDMLGCLVMGGICYATE